MSQLTTRRFRLRHRPEGPVTTDDLEFLEEPVPDLGPDQALIRALWLSIDPANRIWMSEVNYSLPPVPIGGIMRGFGIGQVVKSQRNDMEPGDFVSGLIGWTDYVVADAADEAAFKLLPHPTASPMTALLGPLGHTGVTAYLGVHDIGRPQPGETMVVSAAAGAVGSVAGQIGKAYGARVVGIASSTAKCRYVVENLGFDDCINRKDIDWRAQLDAATPNGIDVDFENVGGQILDHVLTRLNVGARVILCGLISDYNDYGATTQPVQTQTDIWQAIMVKRAHVQSFLVLDHADRFPEATAYLDRLLADGKLTYDETIIDGLEHAPKALNQLFDGSNTGKLLIKVAEPIDTETNASGASPTGPNTRAKVAHAATRDE